MPFRSRTAFCFAAAALVMACRQGMTHALLADGGGVAGCSAGGGCGALAATRWAGVFGLSVAWAGAAVYGALAAMLVLRPVSSGVTRTLAWSVAGAALWFVGLQAVLGKFCVLCCVTHALGLAAALLVILPAASAAAAADVEGDAVSGLLKPVGLRAKWRRGALPGLLMTAALALTQALQPAPASSHVAVLADPASGQGGGLPGTAPAGQGTADGNAQIQGGAKGADAAGAFYFPVRNVAGQLEFPGAGRFAVQDFPGIGPAGNGGGGAASAPVPALLLFDWTCPHCREVQGQLASRKPGGAAFLLVPGHTSEEGKEIHRQLLTAFYADPAGYAEVSSALLSGGMTASPERVKAAMEKRLGSRRWEKSLAGTASKVNALIALGDTLMNRTASTLKASSLPQIISPRAVLTGTPDAAKVEAFLANLPAQALRAADLADAAEKALAGKQSSATAAQAQQPTEGAVIRFASQTFSSAPVAQGEVAHLEIHFDNPGTAPLKILSCNGGCGCVAPSGVEQTVPPGGRGSFKVDFKSAGQRVGTSTRSLRIYSDAANVPAGQPSFVAIAVPVTPPTGAAAAAAANSASSPAVPRRGFAVIPPSPESPAVPPAPPASSSAAAAAAAATVSGSSPAATAIR